MLPLGMSVLTPPDSGRARQFLKTGHRGIPVSVALYGGHP